MLASTVSNKGQVVIPAAYRHALGIKAGVELEFEIEGDSLRVRARHAAVQAALEEGYGMLTAKAPAPGLSQRRLDQFDVSKAMKALP